MQSINGFAESLGSGTVTIHRKGEARTLTIRALSAAESERLVRVYPEPVPPMMNDPEKGSLAPKVPNRMDPEYLEKVLAWDDRWRKMYLAAALDLDGYNAKAEDAAAFKTTIETLADQVGAAFTAAELSRIWREVMALVDSTAADRVKDFLVVDLSGVPADAVVPQEELPESYGTTRGFAVLEVCEMFKIDPARIDGYPPGLMNLLIGYVRLRRKMETPKLKE